MNFSNCLWFKFGHCRNIGTPCIKCRYGQPTVMEFNKIYKEFQEMIHELKQWDNKGRRRRRAWKRWHDKYLEDLYGKGSNVRCPLDN